MGLLIFTSIKKKDIIDMSENVVPTISRQKKILFSVILILVPFILIAVLEITLRIFSYGTDLKLFEKSTDYPGYYEINKKISDRYFSVNKGPGPVNDIF